MTLRPINQDLFPETLLVECASDYTFTTTLKVAEHFGKQHKDVLRKVERILADLPDGEFGRVHFEAATFTYAAHRNLNGGAKMRRHSATGGSRVAPMYRLTEEGFALLVMGFSGPAALGWKVKFLKAFRAMEHQLHARTERESSALFQLRPRWRVIRDNPTLDRQHLIALTGHRSTASITANRRRMRQVGLLPQVSA